MIVVRARSLVQPTPQVSSARSPMLWSSAAPKYSGKNPRAPAPVAQTYGA